VDDGRDENRQGSHFLASQGLEEVREWSIVLTVMEN